MKSLRRNLKKEDIRYENNRMDRYDGMCFSGIRFVVYRTREVVVVEERVQDVFVDREVEVYVVTATVYHATKEQCDSDCLVTASGARIASAESAYDHRYIAVSRDLLDVFPYGTKVEVSGCGELDGIYCVVDTMAKRFKGYVDILINPDMRGGKWEGIRIKKVK